jgi:PAS domain S-box-containing protein
MAVSELSGGSTVAGSRPCTVDGASFEEFTDAFVELDRDGLITAWNAQAEATFGWRRLEAIGQPFSQLMVSPGHRDDSARILRRFFDAESKPARSWRREIVALHREGREVAIELSLFSTSGGEGHRGGLRFERSEGPGRVNSKANQQGVFAPGNSNQRTASHASSANSVVFQTASKYDISVISSASRLRRWVLWAAIAQIVAAPIFAAMQLWPYADSSTRMVAQ